MCGFQSTSRVLGMQLQVMGLWLSSLRTPFARRRQTTMISIFSTFRSLLSLSIIDFYSEYIIIENMTTNNASTESKKSTTRTTSRSSYTESLAYDPQRLRFRTTIPKLCLLNIAPKSSLLDKSLGLLSIVTSSILLVGMCIGMIVIIVPSVIFTKVVGITNYFNNPGSSKANINVSKIGKGSVTAIKTLSARSQMNIIGGGPDELAPILMKQTSLFGADLPGSTLLSHLMLFVFRINFYLTGRIINDQIGYIINRYYFPFRIGEVSFLQVRTCWLDDCIESFVRKNLDGITGKANVNVVILGAGYDSRCYRLNLTEERGVHTYEVDTTGTQAEKLRVLQQSNIDTNTTKFVSCDFESEDWLTRLRDYGFDSNLPTLCVWEGVTMYLDRNVIQSTISKIGTDLGVGSCIAFDYVDASWALSPMLIKVSTKGGEPWKFGMEFPSSSSSNNEDGDDDDDVHEKDVIVSKFVSDCNDDLKVLDHLRHEELIKRYLPKHYDGRPIGFLGDFGGLLLIGKLD